MTISRYFKRKEFACQCGCGFDTIDAGTLKVLEEIRMRFAKPVRVTSGCRCLAHNKAVGGVPTSQHVLGRACDIQVQDTLPKEVADVAESLMRGTGGVGRYDTFTHIDTRLGKARWG